MYFAVNKVTANGVQTQWEFNFDGGYISQDHVKVRVTSPAGVETVPAFTWVGVNTIQIVPAVAAGYLLEIYRDTPKNAPLVDYTDGAIVNEKNLDKTAQQSVFIAAETFDRLIDTETISDTANTHATQALADSAEALALANQAIAVANLTGDAAAEAAASAANAASSAANAATSANAAAASAAAASGSASTATTKASQAMDSQVAAAASQAAAAVSEANADADRIATLAAASDAQDAADSASLLVLAGLGFTNSTAYDFGFVTDTAVLFPTDCGTIV